MRKKKVNQTPPDLPGAGKKNHVGVSKNGGTPKSSILRGCSIIFTIHFGVPVPPFLETPMCFLCFGG